MKTLIHCPSCKHHHNYTEFSECEMGRHTELSNAEKNNWIVECKYYEGRK